jgi:hypothetical protein
MKKLIESQSTRNLEVNNDFKVEAASSTRKNLSRVGFWAALLTSIIAVASLVIGFATPARAGPLAQPGSIIPYPYTNAASFVPDDYTWLYPGILLAITFVVLMTCIHRQASEDKKIFSQVGLSFAFIYAVAITTDYFIQLAVVQPSILSGETAGLSLFTMYNPHGIFLAIESLGYLMLSVALLFASAVFAKGRVERAIRWLFVTSFVLAIGSLAVFSLLGYDIIAFEVTILTINWIVLIVSGALLSIIFKRAGSTSQGIPRKELDQVKKGVSKEEVN